MTTSALDYSVYGQICEAGTTSREAAAGEEFYAIQVIADAVVANMTWLSDYSNINDWSAFTGGIPAGTVLTGRFSQIQLTSGSIIIHKRFRG